MKHEVFLLSRVGHGFYCFLFALLLALLMSPDCQALDIVGGTFQRHDRFYQGPDKAFIAPEVDWSGVGRSSNLGRGHWLTMISPSYFISANHSHTSVGVAALFNHTNDPNGPSEEHVVASGQRLGSTDTWLGKLATPVSDNVAKYAIYPLLNNFSDYQSKEIYVVGKSPFSEPADRRFDVAIGRDRITSVSGSSSLATLRFTLDYFGVGLIADETRVADRDSGGPSFIIEGNKLGFVSTHWSRSITSSTDAFVPLHLDTIKAIVEADGESLVVFIPEPATWSLITLSLMGVSLRRNRKNRSA